LGLVFFVGRKAYRSYKLLAEHMVDLNLFRYHLHSVSVELVGFEPR